MLYNILINQKELSEFKGLDYDDAAILQLAKDMLVSSTSVKVDYNKKAYVWMSYKFVKEQLPMLKSNGRTSIYVRIQKLVDHKILERHPNNNVLGKTFVCAGRAFDKITGLNDKKPRSGIEHPVQDSEHPRSGFRTGPVQDSERNNTHNYNTHNNSVKEEFEKFKKEYPFTKCTFGNAKKILEKSKIKIEDVVHLFFPAIVNEIRVRQIFKDKGEFFPSPAMMTTWLNQQRWTQEFAELETNRRVHLKM